MNYEGQGTAPDAHAVGYERLGRQPTTTVTVPLAPSPAMREILTGKCGAAYRAIRRWHPGLPEDPHPVVQAALEDAFMEAYRCMMGSALQMQNGTNGK